MKRRTGSARAGGGVAGGETREPSPRALADEAETLQQQGERRKGLEAAAKFEAAANKYQQALDAVVRQRQRLGLGLGPPDGAAAAAAAAATGGGRGGRGEQPPVTLEDAVEMRGSLAECFQLLGEAVTAAAAARPDAELSADLERQAAAAAIRHLTTAAGHYACCQPSAVLTTPAPGAAEAEAATAAAAASASTGVRPSGAAGLDGSTAGAFAAAGAVASAATAAAPSLGADVAVNAGNCLAALGEQLEEVAAARAAASGASASGTGSNAASGGPSSSAGWLPMYDTALRCYRSAAVCYRSALAQEEDALTLGNLGDVLVQSGACLYGVARAVREAPSEAAAAALAAAGVGGDGNGGGGGGVSAAVAAEWVAAREAEAATDFTAALTAYEAACSLSDSAQGDDLPGLLCNWGAGLLSMAGCLQDPAAKLPLLEQAAGRLEHAASFDRGDPAPLVSLGDVLAAAGEAAEALAEAEATGAAAGGASTSAAAAAAAAGGAVAGGAAAAAAAHWRGVAGGHLAAALDRGYSAALRLRSDEPEALVGCGEVHVALARLAAKALASGLALASASAPAGVAAGAPANADAAAPRRHAEAAAAALTAAVARPERLGGWRQRCDVRYNLACALALSGLEQEAHQLFGALLACGGVGAAELSGDEDLAPLRGAAWLQDLISRAAATAAGQAGPM